MKVGRLDMGPRVLTVAGALAMALAMAGCRSQGTRQATQGTDAAQAAVVAANVPNIEPLPEAGSAPAVTQDGAPSASPDSVPPEIEASIPDTLFARGSVVEITAQASPDVGQIILADGAGRKQPFAYDSTASLWRTFYRVPMKRSSGPLALSVTAVNGLERWRRVWVFVPVEP